jgi:TetR/AcrR family transcriptional regulator, tetracycline repressor protein
VPNKPTGRKRPRVRATRGALTRERVIAEALVLLDQTGIEELTIRGLAQHLGVSPMALYNHVADKEDLLQGVAEKFLAGMAFSNDHPDWRERIRICFRELRSACLAHPQAVRLLETIKRPPLAVFQPMEITLAALAEAGIGGQQAVQAFFLLMNFLLGQLSYEVRGPFRGLDPAEAIRSERLRGAGLSHVENAVSPDQWNFDSAFEFGLATILDGLNKARRPI